MRVSGQEPLTSRGRLADVDVSPDVPTALDGRWARGRRSLYATVTGIVLDAVLPSAYVTVNVTLKVPAAPYRCVGFADVERPPSPKSQW